MITATDRTAGVALIGATARGGLMEGVTAWGRLTVRAVRRECQTPPFGPVPYRRWAMASISTRAFLGSCLTAKVDRAGYGSEKNRA